MWLYQGKEILEPPADTIGFVYIIENLTNGRRYIGKKLFTFSKTSYKIVKLKNGTKKKKKIKSKIPSDWQDYYGSSIELNNDVNILGKENFKREILYFAKTKAEASYIEAKFQFEYKVLESLDFYNNNIQVRVHGNHLLKKS